MMPNKPTFLKALGKSAKANQDQYQFDGPDYDFLETFPTPVKVVGAKLAVKIEVPEFTSVCPVTGQPDFAKIIIEYEPNERCVESKSLKLYLMGFRNLGEFHESCVQHICNDLVALLNPCWIKVRGEFTARGGITFWPIATWFKQVHGSGSGGSGSGGSARRDS